MKVIMIAGSVGIGTGPDARKAGAEACLAALAGLPGNKANALLVFSSVTFDQDALLAGITSEAHGALIVGCSSAGEISGEAFSSEKSVVVLAIASDQMRFWGALGASIAKNAKEAGEECANALEYDSHGYVSTAFFFLDILSGKADQALEGIYGRLGDNFHIYGGSAGDDMLFYETYQYLNDKVHTGSVVGFGLSGDYSSAAVTTHGFLPIGVARKVTRSEGTTLYELDGKPAISIYQEYFGEENLAVLHEGLLPSLAVSYPLGVFMPESNKVVLRNPVFVDQKGGMTFTSAIPEGAEIRLMISDLERGLETTEEASKKILERLKGKTPKAVIVVSSVARKKMLGLKADDEIRVIQKIIGREVPLAGFYTYAQLGGDDGDHRSFHNGSLLIWALAE